MTTIEETQQTLSTTSEERNKVAAEFIQLSAVIHLQGATFAFQSIGGSSVSITLKSVRVDGILTHVVENIRGPWGNWPDVRDGEQDRRESWNAHMDMARLIAHIAKAYLHKLPGYENWWTGHMHDPPYGSIDDLRRFHSMEMSTAAAEELRVATREKLLKAA